MVQQVKDLVLSLLWLGFDLWPRELPHTMSAAKKRKKNKKTKTSSQTIYTLSWDL